jgi:hypothetical protein
MPFPAGHHLATELSSKFVPLISPRHGTRRELSSIVVEASTALLRNNGRSADYRKHSSSTLACMLRALPSKGRCLQSHRKKQPWRSSEWRHSVITDINVANTNSPKMHEHHDNCRLHHDFDTNMAADAVTTLVFWLQCFSNSKPGYSKLGK